MKGHSGWPYPTHKAQAIRAGILAAAIVILAGAGFTALTLYQQAQPLDASELVQDAHKLVSYAAEARLLSVKSSGQPLATPYKLRYSDHLKDEIKSVADELAGRQPVSRWRPQYESLLSSAHTLQKLTKPLSSDADRLQKLYDDLRHTEGTL